MILPFSFTVLVTSLQLADLFAEPMGFLAVWLLFGWLLLRFSQPTATIEDPAVIEHRHHGQADHNQRARGLEFIALSIALYVLLRYWHNR